MGYSKCYGCFSEIGVADICPHCGFDNKSEENESNALPLGFLLADRYVIGKVLGNGGFGITYLAHDKVLDVTMAIKEYLPVSLATRDETTISVKANSAKTESQFTHHMEKFIEEARAIARFNNEPGIVSIQDVLQSNGTVYIIMYYVNGITLEQYVSEHGGKLTFDKTMEIMTPVMHSLHRVHEKGLIHRDISPDNIYITKDNQVKLLDFGAARYVVADQDQSLSVILKHGFAPVEQYSKKGTQGPWTDVYGVAATMYWMLSGVKPSSSMDRTIEDDVLSLRELGIQVPSYVDLGLGKAMSLNYKSRVQSLKILEDILSSDDEATVLLGEQNDMGIMRVAEVEGQSGSDNGKNRKIYPFYLYLGGAAAVVIIISFIISGLSGSDAANMNDETGQVAGIAPDGQEIESDQDNGSIGSSDHIIEDNESSEADDEDIASPDDIYVFKDPVAGAILSEKLDKPVDQISLADMQSVDSLIIIGDQLLDEVSYYSWRYGTTYELKDDSGNVYNRVGGITSLADFEACTNIDRLEVFNVDLSGMRKIPYWPNIRLLSVNSANLMTLNGLEKLTTLRVLFLETNGLSDVEPVGSLINLNELTIANNNVTNMSFLEKLQNMEYLRIHENPYEGLETLGTLTNLKEVHVNEGDVNHVLQYTFHPLSSINGLSYTDIINNTPVTFEDPIASGIFEAYFDKSKEQITYGDLLQVRELIIAGDELIKDSNVTGHIENNLYFMKDSSGKRYDHMSFISSLDDVALCKNLEKLFIWNNSFQGLNEFPTWSKLRWLSIVNSDLTTIKGLENCVRLESIDIDKNYVEDLSPLEGMANLQYLSFSSNDVKDLSPLSGLENLIMVRPRDNPVESLRYLADLEELEQFEMDGDGDYDDFEFIEADVERYEQEYYIYSTADELSDVLNEEHYDIQMNYDLEMGAYLTVKYVGPNDNLINQIAHEVYLNHDWDTVGVPIREFVDNQAIVDLPDNYMTNLQNVSISFNAKYYEKNRHMMYGFEVDGDKLINQSPDVSISHDGTYQFIIDNNEDAYIGMRCDVYYKYADGSETMTGEKKDMEVTQLINELDFLPEEITELVIVINDIRNHGYASPRILWFGTKYYED